MVLLRFKRTAHTCSVLLAFAATGGCERSAPPKPGDTATSPAPIAAVVAHTTPDRSGWDAAAGPALLVQGETRDEAIVLLPFEGDTVAIAALRSRGSQAESAILLGRGGARFTGRLGNALNANESDCRVWPVQDVRTDGVATAWAVGFVGVNVTPIPLDSVELLSSRDSTALAAEASRLASVVTAQSPPSFQGLRFTAHDIRRLEVTPGVHAMVAHVVRKVNQEANPQEEQTLLIAERDSGMTSGPYQLAYAERSHGLEEEVVTPEVIAAVRIAGRPMLIIARDGPAGVSYVLIQRTRNRQWRVTWTSAATRCD